MMIRILAFCALLITLKGNAAYDGPPQPVAKLLETYGIPQSAVSIEVREVNAEQSLLALNSDVPRNPASVIKILTTLAALELLGPTYQWNTHYLIDGKVKGNTLQGNLIMQGGGDPFLTVDRFWSHVLAIRERGIDHIEGNFIIDNTLFTVSPHDRSAFDGKALRLYNVGPDAALTNFSATRFVIEPRAGGINVFADPPLANLVISNKLAPENGQCINRNSGWTMKLTRKDGQIHASFSGRYRPKCKAHSVSRSILSNLEYTYQLFRYLWQSMGGALTGGFGVAKVPETAELLTTLPSRSLAENIASINKFSNNVMARQLLLTIGSEWSVEDSADTQAAGIEAVYEWLHSAGVDTAGMKIDNGSGLSRTSRISVGQINQLLQIAWNSTWRPEFLASFSLAALDGTMRKRLKKTSLTGRARIKTGLINGVRSMAGYVHAENQRHYIVSMMIDSKKVNYWNGNQVQDALLEWVFAL
jgi:D-alanyl-D-alanine carboxypeptidase/D-alanyl-D-alanine-endopeptidase (penicillin-binding protein 4)